MRKSTTAIVLLLMLAIPFQGFAAAMRSGCALGHHRTNPGATTLHQHDGHHDHAATQASAASDADTDSNNGPATECTCGTCGPGTALPVSRTDVALALPEAAPLGRFVDPPIIMITGGPERPPRAILA